MKMKYLTWMFIPAMAFGLAACDNAGNEGASSPSGQPGDSTAGSSSSGTSPYGSPGGSGETQSSQQGTAMPPSSSGGSSG